ncbi:MAG: NAD-dependent epimerase/dehydratase family protein [Anaerolineae bacterium]|nr:MAG: NAD-dependent epimerase/dehydratase family protein [Anaerolineae bacterium]
MNLKDKRLMVIGGAGLVGSHIVDQLVDEDVSEIVVLDNFVRGTRSNLTKAERSPKVRIVEGDMTNMALLRELMEGVDGVFLLASLWLGECVSNPRQAWEVNTLGTWNVIEACLENSISRIVYSSSASVYGNALFTPMTEEHPFNNRTTYGATKIANEQMFRAIFEQHRLPYVGMRYMNIYGSRMDYEGTYVSVIMKVLDKIYEGKRPQIYGDGTQTYDFVHVLDVARANILGMKADCADLFFNIGTGLPTTITELVNMLLELTNSSLEPEFLPLESSFVTHRIGSTELAEKELGFKATVPLLEGLKEVVDWRLAQADA